MTFLPFLYFLKNVLHFPVNKIYENPDYLQYE